MQVTNLVLVSATALGNEKSSRAAPWAIPVFLKRKSETPTRVISPAAEARPLKTAGDEDGASKGHVRALIPNHAGQSGPAKATVPQVLSFAEQPSSRTWQGRQRLGDQASHTHTPHTQAAPPAHPLHTPRIQRHEHTRPRCAHHAGKMRKQNNPPRPQMSLTFAHSPQAESGDLRIHTVGVRIHRY